MNKKTLVRALKILAVGSLILVIAGCSAGGESPQDIVESFFNDINDENLSNLRSYLDSDAGDAPPVGYWSTEFNFAPYEISLSGSGPVNVTADGTGGEQTYRFEFSGSEGNLFNDSNHAIQKIVDTTGSSETVVFPRDSY